MRYQLLIKDSEGNILKDDTLAIRLTVLSGSMNGLGIYQEQHSTRTNATGIVNLSIGQGSVVSGDFDEIVWGRELLFLKTELDTALSGTFSHVSTSQFLSVPYAYHSQTTDRVIPCTQAERNALPQPYPGQMIWNTTFNTLQVYNGTSWLCSNAASQANAGPDIDFPFGGTSAQLSATTPACGRGTWSVWDGPLPTFSDIHDPHATITGQNNTFYRLKWTVSNGCDSTFDFVEIIFGFVCGHSTVSFVYQGILVTYGTILKYQNLFNQKCFMDRNLGASQSATSYHDVNSYGDYYQWGRNSDLHELTNSTVISGTTPSDNPGPYFFFPPAYPYDWHEPQNNNLWQNEYNDPCPEGWRVADWGAYNVVFGSGISNQVAFDVLKLPAAGYRAMDGNLSLQGVEGFYWMPEIPSGDPLAWQLTFNQTNYGYINYNTNYRAVATPVRCMKNE